MRASSRTPDAAWWPITLGYALVIFALTTLKSFFQIGYLWDPANQRVRELHLIPLENWFTASSWFGPLFDTLGNLAFFVPLGWMLAMRLGWRASVLLGALYSLAIEVTQFAFALGRTDVSDLIFNAAGTALGVLLARWLPHRLLLVLTGLAVVVFAVLVVLGPSLGDPDKVVPAG